MNTTSKRARVVYIFVALLLAGVLYLCFSVVTNGGEWVMNRANRHIYTNGVLNSAGNIYDRNGDILAQSVDGGKRTYNEEKSVRKAMLHTVGDSQGFISTGVQNLYKKELIGYNVFTGLYTAGQTLGNDIYLATDNSVAKAALKALGDRKGAVAVYNYKTGEVLCMVSTPTFDPQNKPEDIDSDESGKYEGIYLNRCLSSSYIPGSTFKLITAAAALENISDINKQTFHCSGSYKTDDGEVICNGVHGDVDFTQALNQSCNSAFTQIALQLGRKKLTEQAEKMGFNQVIEVDKVRLSRSSFDISDSTDANLGWAAIGQYTTLANPVQMMMACGAIANDGRAVTPYIVKSIRSPLGIPVYNASAKTGEPMMSASTARQLKKMMHLDVVNKYGEGNFPGITLAAKTGTAQIDGETATSWFVGFTMDDDCPLAFAVAIEKGGAGMSAAGPVANSVLQAAYKALRS